MAFDILAQTERLDPANLTIREQTRLAENPLDLRWPGIFPRQDAPSVKLSEITAVDFRPIGGRREWNAQGREIMEVLGPVRTAEMVPINPTHHIDERMMQHLRERAQGVAQLLNAGIIKNVDQWATTLADAVVRQLEVEAFEAWFQNEITVMDPKTGTTVTVDTGIDGGRYVAANAAIDYPSFMGFLSDAQTMMGSVGGVRMRRARLNEILADAPAFQGDTMSLAGLQGRLNAEGFGTVQIIIDERTYHGWTDGGSAYTTEYYVPEDRIAFQPANGVVGATYFAPVTRAYDYGIPGRVSTINDVVIFHSEKNDGKTLMVEAQANAITLPIEQFVYVVTDLDVGS